jgi:CheY-like chemotaxis protein
MPIMDGWTLAQELRTRHIDVPLVVMTPARNAREWAQEVGATAYISKPVSLPALISRIDQICA